jgi:hypothetical protein
MISQTGALFFLIGGAFLTGAGVAIFIYGLTVLLKFYSNIW